MNQPAATEISPQLKKVKRISAIVHVVLNIIIAFKGIVISFGLIGMAMAGTLRLDIGNGDFDLHVYRGDETASSAQLLIVPHDEGDWDGAFYDQPRVEQAPASVPLTTTMRIVLGFIGLLGQHGLVDALEGLAERVGRELVSQIDASGSFVGGERLRRVAPGYLHRASLRAVDLER